MNNTSFVPAVGENHPSAEWSLTRLGSFSSWWVLSIAVIVANVLVILLFVAEKCLRSHFNYFAVNLAIADLCVGLTIIPSVGLTGALSIHQFFREHGCLILTSYANVILTVTSLCFILISCNRIYEAAVPNRRNTKCLKIKVICANIAVWVTSAVLWILIRMAEVSLSVPAITTTGSTGTCLKFDSFSYISLGFKAVCFFWGPFIVMTLLSIKIALMSRSNLIMSKIMAQTPSKSTEAVTNIASDDGGDKHSCEEHIEGYSADSGIWIGKESVKKREKDHYQSNNKQGILAPSIKVEQDFVSSNGWQSASTEVVPSKQTYPSNEVADTNLIKSKIMVQKPTNSTEAVTNIISDDGGDIVSCNERYCADSGIWIGEDSVRKETNDHYQSNNLQGVLSPSIKVEQDFVLSNGWGSASTKVIPSNQICPTYGVVDANLITSNVVAQKSTNSSEALTSIVPDDIGDGLSCEEQQEGYFADSGIWIGKESVNKETNDHYQSNNLQGVLSPSIKVEPDFVLSNGWRSAYTEVIPSKPIHPDNKVVGTTRPLVAGECQRNSSVAREIQSTTCVFYILLLVFSLLRLPLGILHIYYFTCYLTSTIPAHNNHLDNALFFLFLSTSLTNPIVSIVFQPKFRKTLYLLVCRSCCRCRS